VKIAPVAYVVIAHAAHEQFFRLLSTLRSGSPQAAIVLHFDAKRDAPPLALLRDLNVLMVEPRVTVNWGDISQVDAMLASIEFATRHVDFEWLTFISGQDYPLRPLSRIEADLRSAGCDAFVRAGPAGAYTQRYELRYWNLPRFRHAYLFPEGVRSRLVQLRARLNAAQRLVRIEGGVRGMPARIGVRAATTPFGADFPCFKGSPWMTLNRRAVARLLRFTHERPEVLAHYRRTICPDESYLQSVICNDKSLRVHDDHRRFILWDEHKLAHPVTLTMQHLELLIASGKDFGRKFDLAADPHVLDALDRVVLGDDRRH
jgi:hypothetical protein